VNSRAFHACSRPIHGWCLAPRLPVHGLSPGIGVACRAALAPIHGRIRSRFQPVPVNGSGRSRVRPVNPRRTQLGAARNPDSRAEPVNEQARHGLIKLVVLVTLTHKTRQTHKATHKAGQTPTAPSSGCRAHSAGSTASPRCAAAAAAGGRSTLPYSAS
jgi:hypothetical protein